MPNFSAKVRVNQINTLPNKKNKNLWLKPAQDNSEMYKNKIQKLLIILNFSKHEIRVVSI